MLFIKGTILQRNYRKITILWSFSYNSLVKFHDGKKSGSHNMTMLYPNLCSEVYYKGTYNKIYTSHVVCYIPLGSSHSYFSCINPSISELRGLLKSTSFMKAGCLSNSCNKKQEMSLIMRLSFFLSYVIFYHREQYAFFQMFSICSRSFFLTPV